MNWVDCCVVPSILFLIFFKADLAVNGWISSWHFFAEEGKILAWVDTVLRGGVLYRDVYCLYGPLAKLPVLLAFKWLGPSVLVLRLWTSILNVFSLIIIYWTLRCVMQTRIGPLLGTIIAGILFLPPNPEAWALSRVAIGLAALSSLNLYFRRQYRMWLAFTGALLSISIFYSQEVGLVANLVVVATLFTSGWIRNVSWGQLTLELCLLLSGFSIIAVPILCYFAWLGAIKHMVTNLFIYPRIVVLGFGGLPFRSLWEAIRLFVQQPLLYRPYLLSTIWFYIPPAIYIVSAYVLTLRFIRGPVTERLLGMVGILIFGLILFRSSLARSDLSHIFFASPPALILLVCLMEVAVLILVGRGIHLGEKASAGVFIIVGTLVFLSFWPILRSNLDGVTAQLRLTLKGQFWRQNRLGFVILDLPRAGGIRVPVQLATSIRDTVRYLQAHTTPEETLWPFPNEALLNFLADRPLASQYALGLFAITRQQRFDMVEALEQSRPKYAIYYAEAFRIDGIPYRIALPEPYAYLDKWYSTERRFGPFYVMRRKQKSSP
jgi:hypothetical protein